MNTFKDREKGFEKKFANDQEAEFKINAKRNKLLASWVADILKLNKEVAVLDTTLLKSKNNYAVLSKKHGKGAHGLSQVNAQLMLLMRSHSSNRVSQLPCLEWMLRLCLKV